MPSKLGFYCFCSYACLLSSDYLMCLLPSIYLIGPCPSYDPGWFRIPQSSAFSVILWFQDPVNLRFWVCQSSWLSSFLWDPEILLWLSSWNHGILESSDPVHVTVPGSNTSSGEWGAAHCFRNQGTPALTRRNLNQSGLLVHWNLLVPITLGGVGADVVFYSPVFLRSWVS